MRSETTDPVFFLPAGQHIKEKEGEMHTTSGSKQTKSIKCENYVSMASLDGGRGGIMVHLVCMYSYTDQKELLLKRKRGEGEVGAICWHQKH